MSSGATLLGPGGSFEATLAGYEVREGQLRMASAVERALAEERVLFCEAGTGTGKTLAYLVPALESGKRVIISTATRALGEQIMLKDIPLIERALGRTVPVALMKGLRNYLCLRRFNELRSQASPPVNALRLRLLDQWYRESETGDFSELAGLEEEDPLLGLVNSSSETRVGSRCTYYEDCFVTRMKRQAEAAQVVVVNHHLFFADLALRGPHPGRVLPHYDAVIFDEAHQVEDIAALFFGVRISERRVSALCGDAERVFHRAELNGMRATNLPAQVDKLRGEFFQSLRRLAPPGESRVPLERDVWSGALYRTYLDLDASLDALESAATHVVSVLSEENTELADALDVVIKRAHATRDALSSVVDTPRGRVTWFEPDARASALTSSPVEVADILRDRIFAQIPCVIMTSATLTAQPLSRDIFAPGVARAEFTSAPVAREETQPSEHAEDFLAEVNDDFGPALPRDNASPFAFIRSRLGADRSEREVDELVLPSPFDFQTNALLYLPRDLPLPKDAEFHQKLAQRISALVNASDGGAFVLTTSFRTLRALRQILGSGLIPNPLLVQGETPKRSMLAAFRQSGRAVLLATLGFWEGVDVPGNALRLVILEKLPFPVPNDPLFAARARALEEVGGNSFNDLSVPSAQMTLKQGFGRLIRSQTDRGVVALMDSRVHRRGYGQRVLCALPPARRTTSLEETVSFLREINDQNSTAEAARGKRTRA